MMPVISSSISRFVTAWNVFISGTLLRQGNLVEHQITFVKQIQSIRSSTEFKQNYELYKQIIQTGIQQCDHKTVPSGVFYTLDILKHKDGPNFSEHVSSLIHIIMKTELDCSKEASDIDMVSLQQSLDHFLQPDHHDLLTKGKILNLFLMGISAFPAVRHILKDKQSLLSYMHYLEESENWKFFIPLYEQFIHLYPLEKSFELVNILLELEPQTIHIQNMIQRLIAVHKERCFREGIIDTLFTEDVLSQITLTLLEKQLFEVANIMIKTYKCLKCYRDQLDTAISTAKLDTYIRSGKWQMLSRFIKTPYDAKYTYTKLRKEGKYHEALQIYQENIHHFNATTNASADANKEEDIPVPLTTAEEIAQQEAYEKNAYLNFPLPDDHIIVVEDMNGYMKALTILQAEAMMNEFKHIDAREITLDTISRLSHNQINGRTKLNWMDEHIAFIGLDSEWTSNTTSSEILQVATATHVLIFLVKRGNRESLLDRSVRKLLRYLMINPQYIKIGFAFTSSDIQMLRRAGNGLYAISFETVHHLVELNHVFEKCNRFNLFKGENLKSGLSLSTACKILLGKEMNKRERLSKWSNFPLTQSQLHYAALDAHCLLALLESFLNKLNIHDKLLDVNTLYDAQKLDTGKKDFQSIDDNTMLNTDIDSDPNETSNVTKESSFSDAIYSRPLGDHNASNKNDPLVSLLTETSPVPVPVISLDVLSSISVSSSSSSRNLPSTTKSGHVDSSSNTTSIPSSSTTTTKLNDTLEDINMKEDYHGVVIGGGGAGSDHKRMKASLNKAIKEGNWKSIFLDNPPKLQSNKDDMNLSSTMSTAITPMPKESKYSTGHNKFISHAPLNDPLLSTLSALHVYTNPISHTSSDQGQVIAKNTDISKVSPLRVVNTEVRDNASYSTYANVRHNVKTFLSPESKTNLWNSTTTSSEHVKLSPSKPTVSIWTRPVQTTSKTTHAVNTKTTDNTIKTSSTISSKATTVNKDSYSQKRPSLGDGGGDDKDLSGIRRSSSSK